MSDSHCWANASQREKGMHVCISRGTLSASASEIETRPIVNHEHTLAVPSTQREALGVDKAQLEVSAGLRCVRLTASLFTNTAQWVLGKFCLLGLQGSKTPIKTVEFLINLDLLQRTPEFHQLHQSCTVQSFRNPRALSKTPHPFELCVIPLKQRSHEYKQHSAFSYGHK